MTKGTDHGEFVTFPSYLFISWRGRKWLETVLKWDIIGGFVQKYLEEKYLEENNGL